MTGELRASIVMGLAASMVLGAPALAHHSYAMFDMST